MAVCGRLSVMKLRTKLILLIWGVMLVVLVPLTVYTLKQMHQSRMESARQLTSSVARSVADIEVTAAMAGRTIPDDALAAHIRTSGKLHPSIAYIVVTAEDGRVRAGNVNTDVVQIEGNAGQNAVLAALAKEGAGLSRDMLVYEMDIERSGKVTGRVKVAFNLKPYVSEMRTDIMCFSAIALLMLIAGGLGAAAVAGHMSAPLEKMSAAMTEVAGGNLDVSVDIRRSDEIGLVATAMNAMVVGLKEKEWLRSTFTKYVSHQVADKIMSEGLAADFDGEMRNVSILFCDMRGFTAMAENLPPRDVIKLLNEYFRVIVDVVFKYDGMIDKFVGDQIMVLYGAPVDLENSALRAVATAVEVQNRVKSLNEQRMAQGMAIVNLGIGINSGDVVAGNVGHNERTNYTVIGDEVNLAQRIESQTPMGQVLISERTYALVKDYVTAEALGPITVKGRQKTVVVYKVESVKY